MDDKIYLYENWDIDGIFGASTISDHAQEVADTLSRTLDSCRTKHYVLSRDKKFLKRYEEMYGIRKDGVFKKYMEEKNEVKTLEDIVEYRGFTAKQTRAIFAHNGHRPIGPAARMQTGCQS